MLIDTYIEWQYTHGIVLLYLSTGSELVESTLGHPGENVNLNTGNINIIVPPALLGLTMGSIRSSWSLSAKEITSMPKVRKVPSKNLSIRNI